MTVPQSIIVGAALIGASIISARVLAPYQLASGPAFLWRINTMTGEIRECLRGLDASSPRIVSDCK
jgi:hypothetical protein